MVRLSLCKPGKYKIVAIKPRSNRLQEMGFLINKEIHLITNNSLGIRIRINNATYLINEITALIIYVQPIGE